MPSADQFNKHLENTKKRAEVRAAQTGSFISIDYFGLSDGECAQVRFLEQGNDLQYGVCHKVPISNGRFIDLVCLNQTEENLPCPMCLSMNTQISMKRSIGFVNLIWRGDEAVQAPNFVRAPTTRMHLIVR